MKFGFFKKSAPKTGTAFYGSVYLQYPLREVPFVFVDTELTGLDEKRDSILSIGALKMNRARIELGNQFYCLVKPTSPMNHDAIAVHEITPSEVSQVDNIQTVLPEFLEFCGNDVIVGHFTAIDLDFINREMKRWFKSLVSNPALDTFILYQWLWRRWSSETFFANLPPKPDLFEMAKAFDIPIGGAHNALMDAFLTAQVFQRLLPWLEKSGVHTLADIVTIGDPYKGGEDRFRAPGQISNF
jgi:DNA polymerase III subunit epsilon